MSVALALLIAALDCPGGRLEITEYETEAREVRYTATMDGVLLDVAGPWPLHIVSNLEAQREALVTTAELRFCGGKR